MESIVEAPSAASWAAVCVDSAASPASALLRFSSWKVTRAVATYFVSWESDIPAAIPAKRSVTAMIAVRPLRRTRM